MAITPAGFFGESVGKSPDVWVPLRLVPRLLPHEPSLLTDASTRWLQLIGRRHPDMPLERTRAGLQLEYDQWSSEFAPTGKGANRNTQEQLRLEPATKGLSALRTRFAQPLLVLLGVTGLVLLTGCLNIASLLLARTAARQPEFAIRLSLGAARTHLLRQMIAEGVLLATIALVASLVFAHWASRLLLAYVSTNGTPLPVALPLDARVLGFASATAVLSILIFGIGPAVCATNTDLALALKGNGAAPRLSRRIGSGQLLVVLEVGACLVLLVAAGPVCSDASAAEGISDECTVGSRGGRALHAAKRRHARLLSGRAGSGARTSRRPDGLHVDADLRRWHHVDLLRGS